MLPSDNEPSSIFVRIVQAVEASVENLTPEQIATDVKLALELYLKFKTSGLHPSVIDVIKFLL
jgi:hypothetical protein